MIDLATGEIIASVHTGDWLEKMINPKTWFVIYSPNEQQMGQGGGYWSNDDGWVNLDKAMIFADAERREKLMPTSLGSDAVWVEVDPVGSAAVGNCLPKPAPGIKSAGSEMVS